MEKWKSLTSVGHELGNHTLYHPCQKSEPGMEWIKNYLDLDHYTVEQILGEIQVANGFLQSLDGLKSRTFAYPCAHLHAGGINFKDSLSRFVTAARGASEEQLALVPAKEIDLYNVPSWAPNNNTGKDLIDYLKKIIASKTLSTFTFHGVNGDHMAVSKEAHEQMLQFLDSHRDEIWVATFKEATDYLRKQQK
jgi:sialate O-acetylesterase